MASFRTYILIISTFTHSIIIFAAPIPGGCNLTFKTEIAPYQIVKLLEDMIRVDAQAPSTPHKICEQAHIHVEFYHLYLKEHYLSEDNYFDGIDKMLTVESIRTYGRKVIKCMHNTRFGMYLFNFN